MCIDSFSSVLLQDVCMSLLLILTNLHSPSCSKRRYSCSTCTCMCYIVSNRVLSVKENSYLSVLPDSRYQLRHNNNGILLERPRLRTKKTLGDRALSMAAPFLWNSLPLPIRQETSIDSFKRSVNYF